MPPRKKPGITVRTRQDGSKSYHVRWRDGGGRDGKPQSHTFAREREAVDARARIIANGYRCDCPTHAPAAATPLTPASDGGTFGAFAARHAAALTGVGPGYRARFRREMDLHFGIFANRPLDGISELDVRDWIVGMEAGAHPWLHHDDCDHRAAAELPCNRSCKAARSATTIKRLLVQAGSVMAAAINDGLATRNPFRGHRLGRVIQDTHKGMTFLDQHEWKLLEAQLPEGVYRDLAAFLIGSGLRWGEATALHVGDVDILTTPARVHVRQAWKSNGKGGHELGPPKSARSRRTVPLPDWVRDLLIPHVAGKRDDELVFVTPRGAPIRSHNYRARAWVPAIEAAQANGLTKRPRVHDLRHSWASWAIAAGVSMTEVSRRMGHSSAGITDQRYTHLLPSADTAFTTAMEQYRTRTVE